MTKYAVMVVLDLDVDVVVQDRAPEIERHTERLVRLHLEGAAQGIKIRMIRTKMLGLAEKDG